MQTSSTFTWTGYELFKDVFCFLWFSSYVTFLLGIIVLRQTFDFYDFMHQFLCEIYILRGGENLCQFVEYLLLFKTINHSSLETFNSFNIYTFSDAI